MDTGPLEASERRIRQRRNELVETFPSIWQRMIAEWNQPASGSCAWLMYSASYLIRTNNVRWAIDPIRLNHRLAGAPTFDCCRDLEQLSFVLLTHRHRDHLDSDLIRSLRDLPITWIVPASLLQHAHEQCGLSARQIIVPRPMEQLDLHGIRITPFDGLHYDQQPDAQTGKLRGVPAVAYLVEFAGKRWLFPGDTRTYDAALLPGFGPVDGLFAHLWLGRASALEPLPPYLDDFCRFCRDLHPRRVILAHLEEFGRDSTDYWDRQHAEQVRCRLKAISPDILVTSALLGDSITL